MIVDLRRVAVVDAPVRLAELYDHTNPGDEATVRWATSVPATVCDDLLEGAGFGVIDASGPALRVQRLRTLADRVAPHMRVLLCGLNPSVYAADAGVGFARPGNRFWPAALASGLLQIDRDAQDALVNHRVGMTDLVKRATARADELSRDEYVRGAQRVERLCTLLTPRVLCVVGITGWRTAVDRRAHVGVQPQRIGTTTVYVMPNPSGLNAHDTVDSLAAHLANAAALADR